ncbi:MAG: hypothetical protein H6822_16265 [Planctomycetaceae bacterium]|nr:hypothetical protein [Planctomycetales bacterium]MCB9923736.1 hypothetical protein [Planctomycetaceae bacterium]
MIERRLLRQLEKAGGRFRHLRLVVSWSVVWSLAAVFAVVALLLNRRVGWYSTVTGPVIGAIALLAAFVAGVVAMRTARDYRWVAHRVEQAYPDLREALLAAIAQRPAFENGRFSYLQANVIQDTLHHSYAYTWKRVVPWSRLATAHLAHLGAFLLFVCAVFLLDQKARPPVASVVEPIDAPVVSGVDSFEVTIEPGDTEVERGTGLLVLARFQSAMPLDATLVYESVGAAIQLPMTKPLKDAVFGGRVPEVNEPLSYYVEYAGSKSDTYHVTVFDYPALVRSDAKLIFPNYTSMEERLIQDVRRVSAVVGTRLELLCYLNKPVATARLVAKDGATVDLQLADEAESLYSASIVLTESQRYELELVDDKGRMNKQPPTIVINVLPNNPPDLKLVQPSRDTRVSPLEELDLKANVWDDYGVNRFGFAYALGAIEPTEVQLGSSAPAKQRTLIEHLVAFEDLEAEPDQLLSYHFWAEDTGPDGEVRRVSSDMYFAEVRHFEEIFREGQSPPGGEPQEPSEQAKQAEELADLQKQIINGTWKVIRREIQETPTADFAEDTKLLVDSQADAMAQVEELAAELADGQSQQFVKEVLRHMGAALQSLSKANEDLSIPSLRPALTSEQAAYQALLRLRAREYEVTRSQQSQSSSSSSSSSSSRQQQQLEQLELDNEENRYETEQAARSEQERADRENRQVLNRLGELARRQSDLNERLKEMQSALEEAATEQEREEIRRQLKRLQEEQQQVLRDTEELQQRMERPENQEQMADAREQLEQTRENVRQASEALEEGRVSRALASGTRAENDLDELREEFRRRASGRFNEEMREMREEARRLDEAEQQLSDRLTNLNSPENRPTSLRDTGDREELVSELEQQTARTRELLDKMQDTVMQAEESEPLLADQLYDAARNARQQELDATLNTARRMLEYGFLDDARREEGRAREGISQLREGIERAADSVLGDETEALRRARETLDELSNQLANELSRENPRAAGEQSQEASRSESREEGEQGAQAASGQNGVPPGESPEPSAESASSSNPPNDQTPPEGSQPGRSSSTGEPSDGESQQPNQTSDSRTPGDSSTPGQPGSPNGQASQSPETEGQLPQSPPSNSADGQPASAAQSQAPNGTPRSNGANSQGGFERAFQQGTGGTNNLAPIGGDDFVQWSDRLRDVEEMLDDPDLRAEVARIRDRARGFRIELKRHSKEPSWDLVELQVAKPLAELRDRIAEELLRRTSDKAAIPLDRDPVPSRFTQQVREYYERLGSGQ